MRDNFTASLDKLMEQDKLDKLLETHITATKELAVKQPKGIMPMLIINGIDFETSKPVSVQMLLADMPSDHDHKVRMFQRLGEKLATDEHFKKVMFVVATMVSEVWYAIADIKNQKPLPEEVTLPLSESKVRAEALAVNVVALNLKSSAAVLPIMRAKNGNMMIVESKIHKMKEEGDGITKKDYLMGSFWFSYVKSKKVEIENKLA